jgi:mevalonate kinase
MRNVLSDEYNVILDNFDSIYDNTNFVDILTKSNSELIDLFTLDYKDLFHQVKDAAEDEGLSRGEISYCILKLRRLLANMQNSKICSVAGGIRYSEKDIYNQFPKFMSQAPSIVPTIKTINKIRVKALVGYDQALKLKDLRSLRSSLIKRLHLSETRANYLVSLYREMLTRSEMNHYSELGDKVQ